ncbi:ribonuclease HI [Isoptericola sp. CG 20/1183]|uniref:ribonuclease H n=1 Tax=Isoptericola halotolerans TaxID=300560 RepID=A0ABX5EHZ9_9MICO|nr:MULTISPECIES: ribonuclease H [Isoptericola]PRZ04113.1 ribonuclease HI [Isoptericola sp. CG 20/1183]PRZ10062.1 ribonuclease HI [Isoptericola halotolerans]
MIIVSTDGSSLTDTGGAIGWAWVAHGSGRFDSGGAVDGTPQVADLTALRRAVEAHPGEEPLFVESASQYAIRCASEWLEGWKAHGWRTASGGPVQHLELVQALDQAITDRSGPVRFRWVRGHVDSPFTERAQQLARLAAEDWAAGRGAVDGLLLDAADAGAGRDEPSGRTAAEQSARDPEPVGARSGDGDRSRTSATSGPGWELDTLFD